MKTAILDLGAGNLHSLARALAAVGHSTRVEVDPARALQADCLVLPGVGAFGTAAERLRPALPTLRAALRSGGRCLGICLGMQLLFERSAEGPGEGLGLFEGEVTRLRSDQVPHLGWTEVESLGVFSFAHSYACRPRQAADAIAWVSHGGDRFPAIVRRGSVVGVQFHPEKSSRAGQAFLAGLFSEGA
jgi:imidazole glycerol-phosphate synthase subunit HisH